MKKFFAFSLSFVFMMYLGVFAQSVAINSTGNAPDATAMLDVASTTKGFLAPRMSQAQREAISTPAEGLLVYQIDETTGFYYYNGSSWVRLITSLTNFTESAYGDGSTINYGVKLLATSAQTNVDFVISPKGTGAILVQQPDGSTTGGNKRGNYAVDLQMNRNNSNQVASGDYSFVGAGKFNKATALHSSALGGYRNTASGMNSSAIGGEYNTINGSNSFIGGGYCSTVAGLYSFVGGGMYNNASGGNSFIASGYNNTTSGEYSFVGGGYNNTASGQASVAFGKYATASGNYSFAFNLSDVAGPSVGASIFRISGANEIGGNVAWSNYSDRRLKKDIINLSDENNLDKIMKLNGVRYRWKDNDKRLNLGFIAQDVLEIVPESVRYDELNDIYSMEYTAIIPVLVEGMKEQQEIISEQRIVNTEQSKKIEEQAAIIKKLQDEISALRSELAQSNKTNQQILEKLAALSEKVSEILSKNDTTMK
jgi:hypothetical protein